MFQKYCNAKKLKIYVDFVQLLGIRFYMHTSISFTYGAIYLKAPPMEYIEATGAKAKYLII